MVFKITGLGSSERSRERLRRKADKACGLVRSGEKAIVGSHIRVEKDATPVVIGSDPGKDGIEVSFLERGETRQLSGKALELSWSDGALNIHSLTNNNPVFLVAFSSGVSVYDAYRLNKGISAKIGAKDIGKFVDILVVTAKTAT